jgi:hypothetical protein
MRGIKGLPGLNNVSEEERRAFLLNNADKLKQYESMPDLYDKAADILYNNQQFIKKFGESTFDRMSGSEGAYDLRNSILREQAIDDAFTSAFSPFDSAGNRHKNKGLGNDWEIYSRMSTDAKEQLLNSDWKTPEELEKEQQGGFQEWLRKADSAVHKLVPFSGLSTLGDIVTEPIKQYQKEHNDKILQKIYSDDADTAATRLADKVATAYTDYFSEMSEEDVKRNFAREITPGSYAGNQGISEYAAFYGNGSPEEVRGEMEDFTIDDMRKVLAKKAVYEQYMSPEQASLALNNEAKRYIRDHQGTLNTIGKFINDVLIAVGSYTADKVNGIVNLGLGAADMMGDLPVVMVDDKGQVIDPKKTPVSIDPQGAMFYMDANGQRHSVHHEQVTRTALHNMGKNIDGSDDDSWYNPAFWTKAEQFGTLDEAEQAKYEKIGSSPYKVIWDPGEESNLWYESFKMMSFGIADTALMLAPMGVGAAGKMLSTAGKLGKVAQGLGKGMEYTGKVLSNAKAHGALGALGIGYAYNRGAFQETLAQNLAEAEEKVYAASKQDIMSMYDTDEKYKDHIDSLVKAKAASIKADYLNSGEDIDPSKINQVAEERAREEVLGSLIQERAKERLGSEEYAALQQQAINSASSAAMRTFLPEAIKYGIVNTVGYRSYLYKNPTGVVRRMSPSLKGLEEGTIAGKRRLVVPDTKKFSTFGQKAKTMGKVIGSQAWGGAWTNGTDDMMVDAAERVSNDSFQKYLNSYETGEPIADVYNLADGLYSYWAGLLNSMGQETTWNAAAVGGLGSTISGSVHMANLASLATKEGREAYRNNYQRKVKRDEQGNPIRDEQGRPEMEDVKWTENWRDRAAFFIQNGVLNTYYGKKQNIRALQEHADYVNGLLDKEEDFKILEELLGAGVHLEVDDNENNEGNQKTKRFIHALQSIKGLESLANDKNDPTTLSSVVQEHKTLIDRAASMLKEGVEGLSEEEQKKVLDEYYSANGNIERNEANDAEALKTIAKNAEKLREAYQLYNQAEEDVSKVENSLGRKIPYNTREWMKFQKTMGAHFAERLDQMQSDIHDSSDKNGELSDDNVLSVLGGVNNAVGAVVTYGMQESELQDKLKEQEIYILGAKAEHEKAKKDYENAPNSDAKYEAQQRVAETQAELEEAMQGKAHYSDALAKTTKKKEQIQRALETHLQNAKDPSKIKVLEEASKKVAEAEAEVDKAEEKVEKARAAYNKVKKQDTKAKKKAAPGKKAAMDAAKSELEKKKKIVEELKQKEAQAQKDTDNSIGPVRVLTADEIFALDPVSRAQMMNSKRRGLYSKEQQGEIEKLENRLLNDYDNPLEKIQDISKLIYRINSIESAYSRMAKYPDAAEVQFNKQRKKASEAAQSLIDDRYAKGIANGIDQLDDNTKGNKDITQEEKEKFVFSRLKTLNPNILSIIDEQELLPQYQKQVSDARSWGRTVMDIASVIGETQWDEERKIKVSDSIDKIAERVTTGEELIEELKKAIEDVESLTAKKELQTVLDGLKKLKEQKDAVPVETTEEKKEKEEQVKEEIAQEAEEEEVRMDEAKAAGKEAATVEKENKAKEEAEQKAKAEASLKNGTNGIIIRYSVNPEAVNSITADERAADSNIENNIKYTADYLNGNMTAVEYLNRLQHVLLDPTEELEIADEYVNKYKKYLKDASTSPEKSELSEAAERLKRVIESTEHSDKPVLQKYAEQIIEGIENEDYVKVLNAIHAINFPIGAMLEHSTNASVLQSEVANIQAMIAEKGWKIDSDVAFGKPYKEGMKVAASFEEYSNLPKGVATISLVHKPVIKHGDKIVQNGDINVRRNTQVTAPITTPPVAETKVETPEVSEKKEKKSETPEQKDVVLNRPEGPVSNRIVVGHENGNGASYVTPINSDNKKFAAKYDHAEFSGKGALDSQGNKREEQLQGVDIYDKEINGTPVGIIVFSHEKYTQGSRGQGGFVFNTWRPLTDVEKTKVKELFSNEEWLEETFKKSKSINNRAKELSEIIDNIMSEPDGSVEASETKEVPKETLEEAPEVPVSSEATAEEGDTSHEFTVEDEGGRTFVGVETPSLKEEADKIFENVDGETSTFDKADLDKAEQNETDSSTSNVQTPENVTLSANSMMPYVDMSFVDTAKKQGREDVSERDVLENRILRQKTGAKGDQSKVSNENDSMNNYYAWMKMRGINLQNIIDHELHQILAANPKGVKIKFMAVNGFYENGKNNKMVPHLLLVVDYDDTINKGITRIHANTDGGKNGGIIQSNSEGEGRKYLIVGVAGYGRDRGARRDAYNTLYNPIQGNRGVLRDRSMDFFKGKGKEEEFYVAPGFETYVVPKWLKAGILPNMMMQDTEKVNRDLDELFKDETGRNPYGITWNTAKWMIQQDVTYAKHRVEDTDRVMEPTEKDLRSGNLFLLVPASNGKLVPIYINPLLYNHMRDGALKTKVDNAIRQLVSNDVQTRKDAIAKLSRIFHFNKDDKTIITSNRGNVTTIITHEDGKEIKLATINLTNVSDDAVIGEAIDKLFTAFSQMNPVVNITLSVLRTPRQMEEYSKAGAFTTDAAMLGTAGCTYDIYAVERDGKVIKPSTTDNSNVNKGTDKSSWNKRIETIRYTNNDAYTYDPKEGKYYYPNGNPINENTTEGADLIKKLEYKRKIISGQLKQVDYDRGKEWRYYIIDNGENPIVIKESRSSNEIIEISKEDAKKVVQEICGSVLDRKRDEAAKQELQNVQDVDLGLEDETPTATNQPEGIPETAPEITPPPLPSAVQQTPPPIPTQKQTVKEEQKPAEKPAEKKTAKQEDFLHQSMENTYSDTNKPTTITFQDVLKTPKFGKQVIEMINRNWPNRPSKMADLIKFLKRKGVEIDNIDSSDAGIQAWINKTEHCTA